MNQQRGVVLLQKRKMSTRVVTRLIQYGMPAAIAVISFVILGLRYEVNDDATISNIASGAYGPQTQYLVFVNVLIGYLLKPFYWLLPAVNWYVVLQMACVFACVVILASVLLRQLGNFTGGIVLFVFLLWFGVDLFASFQFVKNAGVLIITGLFLIGENLGCVNRRTALGIVLALGGSMLRFDNFLAVGALAAVALLARFFALDRAGKQRAVLTMLTLFVLVGGAWATDRLIYKASPVWDTYLAYNDARSEISDYRLQYVQSSQVLAPLGYSENDFAILKSWNFYDPAVFGLQQMQQLAARLPTNTIRGALQNAGRTLVQLGYGIPLHWSLAGVLLTWGLFSAKRRWPVIAGTFTMLCALVFYLSYCGRFPYRVEFVLILATVCFCAFAFETPSGARVWEQPGAKRALVLCAALVTVACLGDLAEKREAARDYWPSRVAAAQSFDALSADKAHLYLIDSELVDAAQGYNVLSARPKDYFSNLVGTGGWLSYAPFSTQALTAYGVTNPLYDAVNREDVYIVDYYNISAKEIYLWEHYGIPAQRSLLREQNGYNIYHLVASPESKKET